MRVGKPHQRYHDLVNHKGRDKVIQNQFSKDGLANVIAKCSNIRVETSKCNTMSQKKEGVAQPVSPGE